MPHSNRFPPFLVALLIIATACSPTEDGQVAEAGSGIAPPAEASSRPLADASAPADMAADGLPSILVYKTATCGCCTGWVEHLRAESFDVDARDVNDLARIKMDVGVPHELGSCHTALIDGYVVEGHVPAEAIRKLLAERPEVTGLSVPGMPIGSPGMEGPNPEPYTVWSFDRNGRAEPFMEIDPR